MKTNGDGAANNAVSTSWTGFSLSQDALMEKDTVLVVDLQDIVIGSASKKESHIFGDDLSGILHRAFSVFLFDSENRLLLHQRAAEKITFPNVSWFTKKLFMNDNF